MNRSIHLAALALLSALTSLAGCSPPKASNPSADTATEDEYSEAAGEHADENGAPLSMTAAEQASAGLRVETLAPMRLGEVLQAPGEVVDNAYGVTLITPRVAALVVRRHAKLGDEVAVGAALVTLSSVEVAEAQGELRIAEQEWKRVAALGRDAVSGRRYTEAAVAVEQARAKARTYGLAPNASGPANGEFTLSAPHAGRLTEDDFVIGQRIEPGDTLFRLVDESTVWVDATLPAEIARRVVVGKDATVVAAGVSLRGRVVQSAHRTAEDTRNAHVRVEVPNEGDQLHAGDFVEVSLSTAGSDIDQLAVPTEAIVQLQGQTVVFRARTGEEFEPVPLKVGAVVADHTIVTDGVTAGDRVVVAGTYALKARMLKAQLGEGHGH
ncbi:MAG: efflux RND transporter periplasmic adaptor subunit [Steroidobacteraceae bacterium]|nr:efflux RND transporter periplasmic adaptor subunit [Pseudomonadota bacterium]MBP6107778.1 efflux RND transporter periplasmic adaptor subunit [Steroidobacteraceae bacterium]MBP7015063.1 efflux RND transporter periplasmic adaptor subunit [Steroidobacteraceae bacterium]